MENLDRFLNKKSDREELPLITHYIVENVIEDEAIAKAENEKKVIQIDYYQTSKFKPYSFYKPISKIL